MARGRYEITKDRDGVYSFRLVTVFGKPVAVGGTYKSLALCKKGIASLRVNSDAPAEDLTVMSEISEGGEQIKCPKIVISRDEGMNGYNFVVKAKNGGVIARGEGYGTRIKCLEAVENLRYTAFLADTTEI